MTIDEFLESRITEDEVSATMRECHKEDCDWLPNAAGYSYPCDCGVPERMTAECAAKRRLIRGLEPFGELDDMFAPEVLSILASAYASHPDYDSQWSI